MIGELLQVRSMDGRASCVRAIVGIVIGLWLAGSVTVVQGTLAPQWTAPHCPEGQTESNQHGHNHCAWHCDGIDTPLSTGRSGSSSPAPTGYLVGFLTRTPLAIARIAGKAPRGPPQSADLFTWTICHQERS
jgi:hypothetical protein